jgi:hypothetical protein
MRNRLWIAAFVAVLFVSSMALAQAARGRGQGAATPSPTASLPFDPHDFSGIWSRNSQGYGGGGTCRGCGDRGFSNDVPPMTPEGQKRFEANKPSYGRALGTPAAAQHPEEAIGRRRAVPPGQGNDLVLKCNPSGMPRMVLYPDPMEFVFDKNGDKVVQTFQWTHQWRTIYTDGRKVPDDPDVNHWYGYSVGHWDGNTFVIDSYGFDDRTWVDHFGYPHSDQMKLQERYRRVDHDTLELSMTLTDPKTYTKPWVSETKKFKLLKKEEISYDGWYGMLEEICAPIDEVDNFVDRVVNPAGGVEGGK